MGKKKQLEGNVMAIELPADEPIPVKKKREMSDKQKENLAKGMAILKAKREAKSKKEEVEEALPPPVFSPQAPVKETPSVSFAPEPVAEKPKKERKPRVAKNYLTTDDFNNFKNELFTTLKPQASAPVERVKEVIVKEVPVITPQIVKETVKERVISGRELLDRLFFPN
jgi:hypothetical protein